MTKIKSTDELDDNFDEKKLESLRYRRRRIISLAKDITEILVSNDFLAHEESIPRRAFDLAESFYDEADRRFGTPMENYE